MSLLDRFNNSPDDSDPFFNSGLWKGVYTFDKVGKYLRMILLLNFSNSKVVGFGQDQVDGKSFNIDGTYSTTHFKAFKRYRDLNIFYEADLVRPDRFKGRFRILDCYGPLEGDFLIFHANLNLLPTSCRMTFNESNFQTIE